MQSEWIYLLRIVVALCLGFAIGFERKLRLKEAGLRTHSIVAVGACLFMLISKYGFGDMEERYDASRIASQIVSGIGFIGAGMILYRRQSIQGLTTAAGVWTTAGVGMAAGAGMYLVACGSAVLIIVIQCVMHINCRLFRSRTQSVLNLVFICNDAECEKVKEIFCVKEFLKCEVKRVDGNVVFRALTSTEKRFDDAYLQKQIAENQFLLSVERADGEV